MLSIFGWAFLIVWLVIGIRYGSPLGQEFHAFLVKFVWDGVPLLLVNLFLVMWLLALVMFGFMFVVAGQGMRAVFEMANSSKQLVALAQKEIESRHGEAGKPSRVCDIATPEAVKELADQPPNV